MQCDICYRLEKIFKYPCLLLMWLINLLFLPDKVRTWLFGSGTRSLEIVNAFMLIAWSSIMLTESDSLYVIPAYSKFAEMPSGLVFSLFGGVGFALILLQLGKTNNAQFLKGFFLNAAALLWILVAVGFSKNYPPLTPSMLVYIPIAVIDWWAGITLMENAKKNKKK